MDGAPRSVNAATWPLPRDSYVRRLRHLSSLYGKCAADGAKQRCPRAIRPSRRRCRRWTGAASKCLNLREPSPEDATNFTVASNPDAAPQNGQVPSDIVPVADMRLLAAPSHLRPRRAARPRLARGQALFSSIGCATCHNSDDQVDATF